MKLLSDVANQTTRFWLLFITGLHWLLLVTGNKKPSTIVEGF